MKKSVCPATQIEVIGQLAHYITRAGYCITPVIGVVQSAV